VPRGGLKFAEALYPFLGERGPVLVVDDVYTTGCSMRSVMSKFDRVAGLVVFARNTMDVNVSAMFTLNLHPPYVR
jgi:orotate phosphoribosyltransferase